METQKTTRYETIKNFGRKYLSLKMINKTKSEKTNAIKQLRGLIKILGETPSEKIIGYDTFKMDIQDSKQYIELTRLQESIGVSYIINLFEENKKDSPKYTLSTRELPRKYVRKLERVYTKMIYEDAHQKSEQPIIYAGFLALKILSTLKKVEGEK